MCNVFYKFNDSSMYIAFATTRRIKSLAKSLSCLNIVVCFYVQWVAASKPKVLGMVNTLEAIPKLRLRLPPTDILKLNLRKNQLKLLKNLSKI